MKVIEIFGPPGAGKSTLATSLKQVLTEKNLCVDTSLDLRTMRKGKFFLSGESIPKKIGLTPLFFSRQILDFTRFLPFLLAPYWTRSELENFQLLRVAKAFYKANADRQFAHANRKNIDVVILDPGWTMMFLNGWLYNRNTIHSNLIKQFLISSPRPDLRIGLTINPDLAIARLKDRTRGAPQRMRQLPEGKWPQVIKNGNIAVGEICKRAEDFGEETLEGSMGSHLAERDFFQQIINWFDRAE